MLKRNQVLLVLAVLSMITFLDRIAISTASKSIMNELGLTPVQWGWILGVFTIAYAAFEVPTGFLGDRHGAKKTLARVVIWWSVFTILTGTASTFAVMLIVRFFFGVGEAGAYPNSSIVLSKWFPAIERGRAQAVIWGASRIGAALTPFVVIPIQTRYGWQSSFFFLGALGFIWVVFWIIWHKERPEDDPKISAEELTFIKEHRSIESHSEGKSYWKIFKDSNLLFLLSMYFCYAIGAYFFQSWFHTYLTKGRNISEQNLLWAASVPYLLAAMGCFFGGFLSDKAVLRYGKTKGRRLVPMIGLAISGLSIIAAALTENNTLSIILLGLGMAAMDITAPVAWAVSMDIGGHRSGTISGTMNTAGLTGAYFSTVAFGYLATSYGYHMPVMLVGVIVFMGSLIWLKIDASKSISWN